MIKTDRPRNRNQEKKLNFKENFLKGIESKETATILRPVKGNSRRGGFGNWVEWNIIKKNPPKVLFRSDGVSGGAELRNR